MSVVVMSNVTSDKQERCVFTVLLKTIDSETEHSCVLANTNF